MAGHDAGIVINSGCFLFGNIHYCFGIRFGLLRSNLLKLVSIWTVMLMELLVF